MNKVLSWQWSWAGLAHSAHTVSSSSWAISSVGRLRVCAAAPRVLNAARGKHTLAKSLVDRLERRWDCGGSSYVGAGRDRKSVV